MQYSTINRSTDLRHARALPIALACLLGLCLAPARSSAQPPPDASWTTDATVRGRWTFTDTWIGAGQGVSLADGRLYVYGDNDHESPRVGVIREYLRDMRPTGRVVYLRHNGKTVIQHPTGLSWDREFGCVMGDTVQGVASIYRLDWRRALADGDLDAALVATIHDDAAVNGCRPEFVTLRGRRLLATADYGEKTPQLRLYDPARLFAAGNSKAEGVVVANLPCPACNQNLHWDASSGRLTCVQNVILGRGWRLVTFDLAKAIDAGAIGPAAGAVTMTFEPHNELEGYRPLGPNWAIFVTSDPSRNLILGTPSATEPRLSSAGQRTLPAR